MSDALQTFRTLIAKIKHYEEAVSVLHWDMRTGAPRKGLAARSEAVGALSTEMFRLSVSEQMESLLEQLGSEQALAALDDVNRRLVEDTRKQFLLSKRIPPELYQEYVTLTAQAESEWEHAKRTADFPSFRPYLEKIVAYTRQFIDLWGYEGHPYNTLVDQYEPGMTVAKLDEVFGELRSHTVPLVQAYGHARKSLDRSFLRQSFDPAAQRKFSLYILKEMGFDFEAGRLDESEHPFATGLNLGDVRITTRYKPDDVAFALFGTIHECGHAMYEQNIAQELAGTTLCTGASMGIHESQSRFWEIYVASGQPFWQRYFGELQSAFPQQLAGVTAERFCAAINDAQPSLIRIEADELTYNLHIMIRYELEKALIGGDIAVADLPGLWNEKYAEYLGVTPQHDGEGVLQDVHWSGGAFGYFPSYTLGNMYAAQLMHALRNDKPGLDEMIERGELLPVKQWLTERVHRFGKSRTPAEIITNATGEPLNPAYLIQHLQAKFRPDV